MTKREKITRLMNIGLSDRDIAVQTGAHEGYVRAVRQRNKDPGIDARWSKQEYARNPTFRKKNIAAARAWQSANRERYLAYKKEYDRKKARKAVIAAKISMDSA